jgi:hypothetical protein
MRFMHSGALSAVASWSVGNFDKFRWTTRRRTNASVNATTARVHLGMVWFP